MPWINARLQLDGERADEAESLFLDYGAHSITLTDAGDVPTFQQEVGEVRLWPEVVVTGLFSPQLDEQALGDAVVSQFGRAAEQQFSLVGLDDEDWSRVWLKHFRPIEFGSRLSVYPTGFEPPADATAAMRLDPGLAFGTGTHPTTAMCLRWLDEQREAADTIIDYGCGSGILALGAALLGSRRVIAVDHDEQALLATRQNAERNKVSARIECYLPEQTPAVQADCLIANILAGPLLSLAKTLAGHCRSGSPIVLSGILKEQAEQVQRHYETWFDDFERRTQDEWVCLVAWRK